MVDALPTVRSGVDNSSITAVETQDFCNFGNRQQQMTTELGVIWSKFTQGHDRLFRNKQHMHRSLWCDIAKRETDIILVNDIRRYFAVDDFEKNRQYKILENNMQAQMKRFITRKFRIQTVFLPCGWGIVSVDRFSCN